MQCTAREGRSGSGGTTLSVGVQSSQGGGREVVGLKEETLLLALDEVENRLSDLFDEVKWLKRCV